MNIVNELGGLVERVALATNRQAEDVWYDVNSCDHHERGVAYAVWPLVLKRYRDKSKKLDKWLADAYGCFCAFTSIAGDADAEGGNAIKALTISAFIAGMVEALSSEAAKNQKSVNNRSVGKLKASAPLKAEIKRLAEKFELEGHKRKDSWPLIAAHINEFGHPDKDGAITFPKDEITPEQCADKFYG